MDLIAIEFKTVDQFIKRKKDKKIIADIEDYFRSESVKPFGQYSKQVKDALTIYYPILDYVVNSQYVRQSLISDYNSLLQKEFGLDASDSVKPCYLSCKAFNGYHQLFYAITRILYKNFGIDIPEKLFYSSQEYSGENIHCKIYFDISVNCPIILEKLKLDDRYLSDRNKHLSKCYGQKN